MDARAIRVQKRPVSTLRVHRKNLRDLSRIFAAGKREQGSISQVNGLSREAKEHGEGTRRNKSPIWLQIQPIKQRARKVD